MASRAAHGFPARGESSPSGASPAIEARGLVKRFGERRALDGVDIDLPRGAFLSIFGPNGAGKTTLLRELALLARPTSGSLRMLGVDALEEPEMSPIRGSTRTPRSSSMGSSGASGRAGRSRW